MKKDPAIEEVRAARMRISKRFGHDTKALLDHYRELEKKHPERMLREPSRGEKPDAASSVSRPRSGRNSKTSPGPRNSKFTP